MDKDKFINWQENNWEELTNGFALGFKELFHTYCESEWNTLQSQVEDMDGR